MAQSRQKLISLSISRHVEIVCPKLVWHPWCHGPRSHASFALLRVASIPKVISWDHQDSCWTTAITCAFLPAGRGERSSSHFLHRHFLEVAPSTSTSIPLSHGHSKLQRRQKNADFIPGSHVPNWKVGFQLLKETGRTGIGDPQAVKAALSHQWVHMHSGSSPCHVPNVQSSFHPAPDTVSGSPQVTNEGLLNDWTNEVDFSGLCIVFPDKLEVVRSKDPVLGVCINLCRSPLYPLGSRHTLLDTFRPSMALTLLFLPLPRHLEKAICCWHRAKATLEGDALKVQYNSRF